MKIKNDSFRHKSLLHAQLKTIHNFPKLPITITFDYGKLLQSIYIGKTEIDKSDQNVLLTYQIMMFIACMNRTAKRLYRM